MMPPWVKYNTFDAGAPLSKWTLYYSYSSAAECQKFRGLVIRDYRTHPTERDASWTLKLYVASQCIAADDPRLKEK